MTNNLSTVRCYLKIWDQVPEFHTMQMELISAVDGYLIEGIAFTGDMFLITKDVI